MIALAKHLWQQLVHDEHAAKIWLASAKTAVVAFGLQVLAMVGTDFHKLAAWGRWEWGAAAALAIFAGGAKASDPVVKP